MDIDEDLPTGELRSLTAFDAEEEDEIQDLLASSSLGVAAAKRVRAQIVDAYRYAWTDFYKLEQHYCENAILSLAATDPVIMTAPNLNLTNPLYSESGSDTKDIDGAESYQVWDLEDDQLYQLTTSLSLIRPYISPHPTYESCTPSQSNAFSKRPVNSLADRNSERPETVQFIKYAGEPRFDEIGYLKQFPFLAWQVQFHDPDYNHWDPWPQSFPSFSGTKLREKTKKPCGSDCFIHLSESFEEEELIDTETRELLKLSPDATPCDLSVIARQPCSKIFKWRCFLYPDPAIYANVKNHEKAVPPEIYLAGLVNMQVLAQKLPVVNATVRVFTAKLHAIAVNHANLGGEVVAVETVVQGALVERWDGNAHMVFAIPTSKLKPTAPLKVKSGSYGLGVFAMKVIKSAAFLGEYIAEEFRSEDDTRTMIQDFLDLNYRFDHSQNDALDAISLGNEVRYFNHASKSRANCYAQTYLVDGSPKIGFWSTRRILKDEEVTFYYGRDYWIEAAKVNKGGSSRSLASIDEEEEDEDEEDELQDEEYSD
ncbi:hypothetical protein EIP91_000512 [Steccherinum ochraceum]|uniref:SET domain-containing protein n=1 Tax=Steccherinum ochraceum TaxID=92696 RepID=A0A4R0S345_9APHY|nr:hypothetical protein EIP91_000512 [Steccherinum ochraceum]